MEISKGRDTRRIRRERNEIARDLRTPKYRKRVVKSKKAYTRKGKANEIQVFNDDD
jgi:hypothetical protein